MNPFNFGMTLVVEGASRAIANVNAFTNSLKGVSAAGERTKGMREFAETVGRVGVGMTAAGAAMALPMKDAIEKTEDFEGHLNRLMIASGKFNDTIARGQAMKFIEKQSVATGYSVDDLTESMYQGVSGFLSWSDAQAVTTVEASSATNIRGSQRSV
jgi:hypothetical protein